MDEESRYFVVSTTKRYFSNLLDESRFLCFSATDFDIPVISLSGADLYLNFEFKDLNKDLKILARGFCSKLFLVSACQVSG